MTIRALADTVAVKLVNQPQGTSLSWPALATLGAASIAGYIAWRQYVTAKTKLRLDIFDKRFAVYQAAETLTYAVLADPSCPLVIIQSYNAAVNQAVFLFGPEANAYLEQLRRDALELRSINARLASLASVPKDVREDLTRRDQELLEGFSKASARTRDVFAPYLQFHKVSERAPLRSRLTRR